MFQLSLPLVAGVGHRFTANYSEKEISGRWIIMHYHKLSLFDSTILAHEVSKFQAILLPTIHVTLLKMNFPAFFTFRKIHNSYLNMLFDFLLSSHLTVNQKLCCLSPLHQTALLSMGIDFKNMLTEAKFLKNNINHTCICCQCIYSSLSPLTANIVFFLKPEYYLNSTGTQSTRYSSCQVYKYLIWAKYIQKFH